MASGQIQRWALLLSAYDYTIHYKQGKTNANADALSRLPLPLEVTETPIPAEVIHLMEHLDATPLSCSQIRRWTDQDLTLSKVKRCVLEGWPDRPDCEEDLSPYFQRRLELGVEEGCVLWGCRVVVPQKGRERALEMLHEAHPGMARMKALARSYMWWPGMDKEMSRLSVHPERSTTTSTPSLELAWKTVESYTYRLCRADGVKNVLTHCGCPFQVVRGPLHNLSNIINDDRTAPEVVRYNGIT